MRILITGANGFVGKNLVPKLINEGHSLFEVTIDKEKSVNMFGSDFTHFPYTSKLHNELVVEVNKFRPEVCIHLASFLTANDDYDTMLKLLDANIIFSTKILDALKNSGLKYFINTGSFAEYYKGNMELDPAYLYTATKTAFRAILDYYGKAYNFKYFHIAPYTIYGGIDSQKKIIDIIYDSLDAKESISLTPGNQILDFIHIDDVSDFFIEVVNNIEKIESGLTFQLGTGKGSTLKDLVGIMENKTNKKANINWGGRNYRPRDVMFAVANTSYQFHLLNWFPKISLNTGVEIYLQNKENETIS